MEVCWCLVQELKKVLAFDVPGPPQIMGAVRYHGLTSRDVRGLHCFPFQAV